MFIFFVLDMGLTLLSLYLGTEICSIRYMPVASINWQIYLAILVIWGVVFKISPLYDSQRATPLVNELLIVGGAILSSWLVFTAGLFIANYMYFPRSLLLYFLSLNFLSLFMFHLLLRISLRFIRSNGHNLKNVLILGAGTMGQQVVKTLQLRPWAGFVIVGFLDNAFSPTSNRVAGVPVLGTLAQTRNFVTALNVEEVIVTLPIIPSAQLLAVMHALEDIPVNIRIVPDVYPLASIRPTVEDLWGIPLIGIRQPAITGFNAILKRLLDLSGALLGIVLASPIFVLSAIAIKLDSNGPVCFIQERIGENSKPFKMYKFRTMHPHVTIGSSNDRPITATHITPVGHFLRRTSIDELPQLFNVLKGDMSLVGPRPEEAQIVQTYSSWERQRLMAKPGITGPMQINGRKALPLKTRVTLELEYIDNYSLWQDFKILLQTVPAVIQGDGAY